MPLTTTITRHLIHYTFLGVCITGFFLSCLAFLCYRLLLKPLAFGLIFLATLPLIGRELLKKEPSASHRNITASKLNITTSE